ncbi:MAG: fibronectin type III domain-containing protein, partial [Verrucomicrobia bacterium]
MAKTNVLLIDDKSAARPPSAHATTARSNRAGHPQEAFREFADLPSLLKNNPPQMNHMNHRPTTKLCPPLGAGRFILPLLLLGVLNLTTPVQARPTLPAAPSNLSASSVSSSRIDLRWQDNSGNESGFVVQRGSSSSGPWSSTSLSVNVTSYSDTGLNANTTYYYRVYAYNSRGSSGYSGVASATTG